MDTAIPINIAFCSGASMNLLEKYKALYKSCQNKEATSQEQIMFLYQILGVLDSKASALMRFDAIMIASASFLFLEKAQLSALQTSWSQLALAAILVFSLVAAGLCLWVVQVSYSFFGRVAIGGETVDCTGELKALVGAATRRTWAYRLAWYLSVAAVLVFVYVGFSLGLS